VRELGQRGQECGDRRDDGSGARHGRRTVAARRGRKDPPIGDA
jgi:hypothetical protein